MLQFFEDVTHGANLMTLISTGLAYNIKQSWCTVSRCALQ